MNPYDDDVIRAPWPYYARLRALGPVVWLSALGNYALTQYDVVKAALRDSETFVSAQGVAADAFGCTHLQGNTVASDPPRHSVLRKAMMPPLTHGALADVRPMVQAAADKVVGQCVDAKTVRRCRRPCGGAAVVDCPRPGRSTGFRAGADVEMGRAPRLTCWVCRTHAAARPVKRLPRCVHSLPEMRRQRSSSPEAGPIG